jgi:hypothetical protein
MQLRKAQGAGLLATDGQKNPPEHSQMSKYHH